MKIKTYTPVFIVTREHSNPDNRPYITTQHGDAMASEAEAHRWNATRLEYSQTKTTEEDGTVRVELDKGILCVKQDIVEAIIDTEDFDEHKPSYTVEVEVTKTWRFEVQIDTSEHDEVEDEYDAERKAEELLEDGEYDCEMDGNYCDDMNADFSACADY